MDTITFQRIAFLRLSLLVPCLFVCQFAGSVNQLSERSLSVQTLTCPDDVTISLAPGECDVVPDYSTFVWSSTDPVQNFTFNPPPGSVFQIGETLVSLAIVTQSGNLETCAFTVTVEENGGGTLVCKDLVEVLLGDDCTETITPEMIILPAELGCPDDLEAMILNQLGGFPVFAGTPPNVVDERFIGQEWTVKVTNTATGNSCWGKINVSTQMPPAITCPPDAFILCNQDPDTSLTGAPLATGCWLPNQLVVQFFDAQSPLNCDFGNPASYTILRVWQATDPVGNITECWQNIQANRIALQEVVFPPDFDYFPENTLACQPGIPVDSLTHPDNTGRPLAGGLDPVHASCNLSVAFTDERDTLCGGSYRILRKWLVIDNCTDELVIDTQIIVVEDEVPPVFEILDTVRVSVSPVCGNVATVPGAVILEECSAVSVEIISPWSSIQTNGGEMSIQKNAGSYPLIYRLTDACGNLAKDTAALVVDGGMLLSCPKDTSISCNFYEENLAAALDSGDVSLLAAQFGQMEFYSNCTFPIVDTATVDLNVCGEGLILRTITAFTGGSALTCGQEIQVNHVSDFAVEFPADITYFCTASTPNFGEPVITGDDCEPVQFSFTDQVFNVVADACYKIVRTWKVVNPCVTGADVDQEVVESSERAFQLAFPSEPCDFDGDGDCDTRTFRDSWRVAPTAQPGEAQAAQSFNPDADPDSDPWDGYITYQQVIKVQDTVDPVFTNNCAVPDVSVADTACVANVTLPLPQVTDCTSDLNITGQIQINSTWQDGFVNHVLSAGTYPVRYTAADNCNNQKVCTTAVKVVEDVAPVAVCKSQIVVDVFQSGFTFVSAFDLNNGSYDNCPGNLKFSFSQDVNDVFRYYDCCDAGLNMVQLWVTDVEGNQSSCITEIVIIGAPDFCSCDPVVAGKITHPSGGGVEDVNVQVTGSNGFNSTPTTEPDGSYSTSIPTFGDYTVKPEKDADPLAGVTTFDLVLITKHILGTQILNSPYKLIAADANGSGAVTTADLVALRKMILFIEPIPISWRFIPKD
ncbi:MAG: HYR domain-containing protein, partial [Bacteroidota bacterium]